VAHQMIKRVTMEKQGSMLAGRPRWKAICVWSDAPDSHTIEIAVVIAEALAHSADPRYATDYRVIVDGRIVAYADKAAQADKPKRTQEDAPAT
jgi:hypothetical protein